MLSRIWAERGEVYITSCVKCFPPNNRGPRKDENEACSPYLERQLFLIDPEIVVLLGDVAFESLLGGGDIRRLHGKLLVSGGRRYFLTYHPAAGMRLPKIGKIIVADLERLRETANVNMD